MKKMICLVAVVMMAGAGFAEGEDCSRWNDEQANIAFPERIGELRMKRRDVFGGNDYSLLYVSRGWERQELHRKVLSVYLFEREGVNLDYDGVGSEVARELRAAADGIEIKVQRGEYASVRTVIREQEVSLPKTGLKALCSVLTAKDAKNPRIDFCAVLVTAYRGRFIKLRYTEAVDRTAVEDTPAWQTAIATIDELIRKGADDHAVDVYAIKDDAERIAALKRKWVAAGDRISPWEMPDIS